MLGKTEGRRGGEWQENDVVGWHHWLNGQQFEQIPGHTEGQGRLECCSPWGCKESDMSQRLNNKTTFYVFISVAGHMLSCCSLYLTYIFKTVFPIYLTKQVFKTDWSRDQGKDSDHLCPNVAVAHFTFVYTRLVGSVKFNILSWVIQCVDEHSLKKRKTPENPRHTVSGSSLPWKAGGPWGWSPLTTQGRCPDLPQPGAEAVWSTSATSATKGAFNRKPRINFPEAQRQELPKKGKIKLLHIHANQNSQAGGRQPTLLFQVCSPICLAC